MIVWQPCRGRSPGKVRPTYVLRCSKSVKGMENTDQDDAPERLFPSWRVMVSAWVLVVVFVILFTGVEALASRYTASPRHANLAGAVIPRHDPACAGTPSGECATGSSLERVAPYACPLW